MNAVDQLRDEIVVAAVPWGVLVKPPIGGTLVSKAAAAAQEIASRVLADDTATLDALRAVLGPRSAWWYGSPLGRLVAPHWLGESVPVGTAAKMLGVTAGRVHQLLGEGKLLRVEDGGVSVRSILDRMEWLDGRETQ